MMQAPTANGSAMMLWPLLPVLEKRGLDVDAFLGTQGLRSGDLSDPEVRISNPQLFALWEAIVPATGDENVGIAAAQLYQPGVFNVLDYLLTSAETLGAGLRAALQHTRLLHDLAELELRVDGKVAKLIPQVNTRIPMPRAQADFFIGYMVCLARRITGVDGPPSYVTFQHAAPDDKRPAQRFFRCSVEYGAKWNMLAFPSAALEMPSRSADPALSKVVDRYAALLEERLPEDDLFIERFRRLVSTQLLESPTLDRAAREGSCRLVVGSLGS